MVSFVAVGDPPLPEPPDPPDPPNPLSIFAQTSISNPSSISLPCSPLHHPLLSTSDLDLGFTIPSYGDIFFALMRCFPAKCSSWFQIYSEICLLLVGVKAKSVGCVVSLSMWPVLCTSQLARRSRGNFSLMAVAKRSSFPLMVVTRRLLLTEIGSDVFVNLSLAPFAPLSSRSFCFASIASLSFILNLSSESLSYSSLA